MNVSNLNCKHLQIYSSTYEQLVINHRLASVKIEGKINDGAWITKTLTYPPISKIWVKTGIPISNDVSVLSFNVKNIFTGEIYNILDSPFTIGTVSAVNGFKGIVAAKFLSMFNKTVTQTSTVTYLEEEAVSFNYTITDLPYYLSAYSIISNTAGIVHEDFLTVSSTDGVALSTQNIVLLPEFFELDSDYTDSIISLKITLTSTLGITSIEETCYFMDCTFKCLLPSVQNFECIDEGINIAMLHYSLTQASNCDCSCDDMYEVFKYIQKKLAYITDNNEDCGC